MASGQEGLLVRTADGQHFTLAEELHFTRPAEVGGDTITVPVGAETDGASIPSEAWSILPPFGPYWLACVLHDWLYRCTQRTRRDCDLILWEGMLALGVPKSIAQVIYNAVDRAGGTAFQADRAAQKATTPLTGQKGNNL